MTVTQISSRFTIAIHIFACIDVFEKDYKITSDFLAGSVNVNPVVIRRLLAQLKSAGLITVARGTGGAAIARPLDEITLYDVYMAVECVEDNELFHFHENPSTSCPVGRNIHKGLDDKLRRVQTAMENEMKSITIKDVKDDIENYLAMEDAPMDKQSIPRCKQRGIDPRGIRQMPAQARRLAHCSRE